jgi:catechol 2,3-dioxygenase-like lactoylglutathione lyase family enzyme
VSLRGFATLTFWADDLAAAAAWYTEALGVAPYFRRPGPDGRPAYVEFRVGDSQAELGLIDRRDAPSGAATGPGGAVMHWHVDDLEATVARCPRLRKGILPLRSGCFRTQVRCLGSKEEPDAWRSATSIRMS